MRGMHLLVTVGCAVLLEACGTAAPTTPPAAPPRSTHAATTPSPASIAATRTAARAPSRHAGMVCAAETRVNVAALLAPLHPLVSDSWRNPLYVCTYRAGTQVLRIAVREDGSHAAALSDFDALMKTATMPRKIPAAASLGLPGFETADGLVVFTRDDMTLRVDARGLGPRTGQASLARSEVAYELATDVLGCWSGGDAG